MKETEESLTLEIFNQKIEDINSRIKNLEVKKIKLN